MVHIDQGPPFTEVVGSLLTGLPELVTPAGQLHVKSSAERVQWQWETHQRVPLTLEVENRGSQDHIKIVARGEDGLSAALADVVLAHLSKQFVAGMADADIIRNDG